MTGRISLPEAADFLRSRDNFLILSHRRPDGDTVGSCAALCRALRAIGKTAWVYENPQFTPKFAPYLKGLVGWPEAAGSVGRPDPRPPHSETGSVGRPDPRPPHSEPGGDGSRESGRPAEEFGVDGSRESGRPAGGLCLVSCDVASRGLFPFGMEDAEVELAIDHHGTNEGFAPRTCVDTSRAACGEIILELLPLLGVAPDKPMAEVLYVAISTDTGCFRYSNVTDNTFRCAAACVAAGAEIYPINRTFFEIKRRARLRLEAHLTEHMEFFAGGRVAVSAIPQALIEDLGLTEDDIDDISGFGRSVEGVEVAVMLREVEGGMGKASVRTSPAFDAAGICRRLGGGGHPAAAGASLPGGIPAIREAVLKSIAQELEL